MPPSRDVGSRRARQCCARRRARAMSESDRIAAFKEVAELMPDDPVVRFGLAGAYLYARQADLAVVEY